MSNHNTGFLLETTAKGLCLKYWMLSDLCRITIEGFSPVIGSTIQFEKFDVK